MKAVYNNAGGQVFKAHLKSEMNKPDQDKKYFAVKASPKNTAAIEAKKVMGEHVLM